MEAFLKQLKKTPLGEMICFHQRIPARPSRWGRPEVSFPKAVREALSEKGITRLYSHQAEALDKIRKGEQVIISTPTASGKSLIYVLSSLFNLIARPRLQGLIPVSDQGPGTGSTENYRRLGAGSAFSRENPFRYL